MVSTIIIAALIYGTCHCCKSRSHLFTAAFWRPYFPYRPDCVLGILTKANVPKKIETIIVANRYLMMVLV